MGQSLNWLFILSYLGVQIFIGLWISRRIRNESDYLLGGRKLSLALVAFSLFATWFGAETCIGSSGAVYERGLSGSRADPFGFSLCLLLMGLLLAYRLRKANYVTLADFYRDRFGPLIEKASVWIIVPSSLFWAAAQLRAFGQIISATTALHVSLAITLSAVFVIIYTLLGGLLGDIYTDLMQGVIIIVGLVILIVVVLKDTPGLGHILSGMEPARLSFIGVHESLLQRLDRWMVPILGSLVTQEAISRVLSARSPSVARKASFVACGIYLVFGSVPAFLGLIGPRLLPGVGDKEQFLIRLAEAHLPQILFVLFAGALVSAILATIDSILLAVSALVSHNLVVPALRLKSEKARVVSARIVVVAAGFCSFAIALFSTGVYELVLTASAFGTAGILVVTLLGLFTRTQGQAPALAALVAGLLLTPLLTYVFKADAPFIGSILGSAASFFAVAAFVRWRPGRLSRLS